MLLKEKVISRYIWDQEILNIVWHDWYVYFKVVFKYWLILLWLVFIHNVLVQYLDIIYLNFFFGSIWLIVYVFFVISFLDSYLDSIILTKNWIIIFRWEGFLRHNTESIRWEAAQSIYHEQNWIIDIIFNKWNVKIKRQDEIYLFEDVWNPRSTTNILTSTRDRILSEVDEEEPDMDKFDVLVDTLWEVILDYVRNNKKKI